MQSIKIGYVINTLRNRVSIRNHDIIITIETKIKDDTPALLIQFFKILHILPKICIMKQYDITAILELLDFHKRPEMIFFQEDD